MLRQFLKEKGRTKQGVLGISFFSESSERCNCRSKGVSGARCPSKMRFGVGGSATRHSRVTRLLREGLKSC